MRRGFTLLECLIALAILAAATGGLYQSLASMAAAGRRSTMELRAAALARSLLDRVGTDITLAEGRQHGTGWSLLITRHGSPEDRAAWPVAAYDVVATLHPDRPGRELSLATIILGPKGQAP